MRLVLGLIWICLLGSVVAEVPCCSGLYSSNLVPTNATCPPPYQSNNITRASHCAGICCVSNCTSGGLQAAFARCATSVDAWINAIAYINGLWSPLNTSCDLSCGQFAYEVSMGLDTSSAAAIHPTTPWLYAVVASLAALACSLRPIRL